jgi:Cu(I)/Ag(I) efflux system membrane fusion protein
MIDPKPEDREKNPTTLGLYPTAVRHGAALFAATVLLSCGAPTPADPSKDPPRPKQVAAAADLGSTTIDEYLKIHEALARDDPNGARAAFTELGTTLPENPAVAVGAKTDDLAAQREAFRDASRAVLSKLRAEGNRSDSELNLAHCPMALDGAGAEWLQRGQEIANPYFGASMLTCGEIQEAFAPRKD